MTEPNEQPILLPTPVPVRRESHIIIVTKFLSWLTACCLAVSVLVALVSVTNERNDLREQLGAQSTELACRSAAAVSVNKAVAKRDNSLSDALAAVADQNDAALDAAIADLKVQTREVDDAIEAQEKALQACDKR